MTESLFSPSWYRVAALKPRLRGHTRVHRHEYRGEVWYVLQDSAKGRFYRFTPAAYDFIAQMDGERRVQELWERTTERLGDEGPTQGEVIQLLSQLHVSDVLLCNVPPDTAELLERSKNVGGSKWKMNLRNPMALRIPLLDPDRFLSRTLPLVRPLFGFGGGLVWLLVVGTAAVQAGLHYPELTRNFVDRILSTQNLFLLALVFPVLKILHEFGHAYAVKLKGGEVHEMGVMLLVLMPVPYVDASAASEFPAKSRRMMVGAAGMVVELFLASLALFAYLALEQGTWRSLAYNAVVIGSVSTLLFNANPLLRYDGYYIFGDLIEIPNLAQRGLQWWGYLLKRYLLGLKEVPPYVGPGERFWFVVYSLASFVYRLFIYFAIVLFIAGKYFFIGMVLAGWTLVSMVGVPIFRGIQFAAGSPLLRQKRTRAVLVTAGAIAGIGGFLFLLPFPCRTVTEGIVWVPEESLVRAAADGFVDRVLVAPDARVRSGQVLIECSEPLLEARARVLRARRDELESRYDEAMAHDQVQAQILREDLTSVRAALARAEEQLGELSVASPTAGSLVLPDAEDLPGLHLKKGDLLGYVLDVERPTIRVVVPQSSVDLVRRRPRRVEVRMADRLSTIRAARVRREVPQAAPRLPSTVLAVAGGGEIATDPLDRQGTKAFENLFQFDVELAERLDRVYVGERAHVRFDHGPEPLGFQLLRRLRQLLLRRLNV